MLHEVDFLASSRIPEIDCEDKVGCINVTRHRCQPYIPSSTSGLFGCSTQARAYLISNSFCVIASFTTSRMHGGGVIGRLSCRVHLLSPYVDPGGQTLSSQ